jgi:tRNA-2-methylthio-N6-dimethylallyladenosine synthase
VALGQTVNAYGRHDVRRGRNAAAGTLAFGDLLAALAEIPGIERLRYTSPHPMFFDDALIRAHAELPQLCPHVHLPVQSGSDRMLDAMRRRYSVREYLELVAALRRARPDVAITTDLIVGHPGETRADFDATLALVREVAFVDGYSFKYSPRPGTASAGLADAASPAESQARLEELQALQRELTFAAHRARIGAPTRVLVEGASRRGAPLEGSIALQGRDPYHRVVDFVDLAIVEATPHSLIGTLGDLGQNRACRTVEADGPQPTA